MSEAVQEQTGSVEDLVFDPANARAHSARNIGMIEQGLQEVGAARSVVIDEHGVVLAGNATVEAALQAGITKLRVVDVDGQELVAVRRTGLSEEQKKRLALYDNRTSDLSGWDVYMLETLRDEMPDLLEGLWFQDELDRDLARLRAQEQAFSPLLNPDSGSRTVTGEDIYDSERDVDGKFQGNNQQLRTVICPHCMHEFDIQR